MVNLQACELGLSLLLRLVSEAEVVQNVLVVLHRNVPVAGLVIKIERVLEVCKNVVRQLVLGELVLKLRNLNEVILGILSRLHF